MKRFLIIFLSTFFATGIMHSCCTSGNYSFYIKVDSGVSCSESANACAVNPPWNPAIQGYNATLGKAPIAGLSVGCELSNLVDVEVNISNRSLFKYRKCQTSAEGSEPYTRKFDLDVTSILFCANFLGRGTRCFNWDVCCGKVYPLVGFGLGGSNLLITNFRTTGLPPTGDSAPYASFSAENEYTLRRKFTYALLAGFEYNRHDCWAVATGYRWFNAGHFNGPRYLRVDTGAAVDVACDAWKMRFRAHEWFIEFKIFI